MSKDASIGWMYDGAKGNVHREDYLLGKKVDKNFEKYSDVVNTQKAEAIDTIVATRTVFNAGTSTGLKTSSLQKDIIKSEDPFVAVKVREETKRRELMDNPLMKMRLQNMLKTMMTSDKKKDKKSKKDKKKKKKRSRSSSNSSDEDSKESKKEVKRKASPSPKRKRRTSDQAEDVRGSSRRDSGSNRKREDVVKRRSRSRSAEKEKNTRRKSRSPRRDRSRSKSVEKNRKRSRSPRRHRSRSDDRARRSSRSPRRNRSRSQERSRRSPRRPRDDERNVRKRSRSHSVDKQSSSTSKSSRQFDSHIPRHLQSKKNESDSESDSDHKTTSHRRRHDSDGEEEEPKSYGLVEMRKRTAEEREEDARRPTKEYKLLKIPNGRGTNNKREPRRVLTDEEKAARLAEMQDNVKWRDDVRSKNAERTREEDKEEDEETQKNGYAPSFIRNQMREACDDMTVEKRLQSRKGDVQRSHGYMDRSFARK